MPAQIAVTTPRLHRGRRLGMVDARLGHIPGAVADAGQSPPEVEVLCVHPLSLVKAAHLLPGAAANEQERAYCPCDLAADFGVESTIDAPATGEVAAGSHSACHVGEGERYGREWIDGVLRGAVRQDQTRSKHRRL